MITTDGAQMSGSGTFEFVPGSRRLWLVGQFGARVAVAGGRVEIQGLALSR